MRYLLVLFVFLLYRNIAISQNGNFPKSWEGNWKGNLNIYPANSPDGSPVQVIPMGLTIRPMEKNQWSWVISYEAPGQQPRNYELIKDSLNNWSIDEKNGIVLSQRFAGNRMVSSFSVMGSLLICYYWLEGETMNMEIHMTSSEGTSTTGLNTEESPIVGIHRFGVFQKAVLLKH